jgi:hypothetical protein
VRVVALAPLFALDRRRKLEEEAERLEEVGG